MRTCRKNRGRRIWSPIVLALLITATVAIPAFADISPEIGSTGAVVNYDSPVQLAQANLPALGGVDDYIAPGWRWPVSIHSAARVSAVSAASRTSAGHVSARRPADAMELRRNRSGSGTLGTDWSRCRRSRSAWNVGVAAARNASSSTTSPQAILFASTRLRLSRIANASTGRRIKKMQARGVEIERQMRTGFNGSGQRSADRTISQLCVHDIARA